MDSNREVGRLLTSTLTAASQTTPPSLVRELLHLAPGDKIGYVIDGGEVRLVNASEDRRDDPVVEGFLAFLARDLKIHPERISLIPESLLERAEALWARVDIDHDAPIEGAIEL